MFKKVIRWTPFVCIALLALMVVGLTQANCQVGYAGYSYCSGELWTTDGNSFGASDILGMFGHADGMHLLGNAVMLLLFAVPAELLLGRKKFIAALVVAMAVQVISGEIVHTNGLGSSGWLMAMPGLMFGAAMWRIREEGETSGAMALPIFGFVVGGIGNLIFDLASSGGDGIDHQCHIIGFVTGIVFVIAGIPFLAMTIREDLRAWRRKRAWKARRAFI